VAGGRWRIQERTKTSKELVGLDHHQVRRWRSWYRWATLAMLGHAFLVVAALLQHIRHPPPSGLTRLTCNELQHLFAACWPGRSVIATTGCAGRCGDDDIKHAPEAATTNAAAWQP
jgi:hypothetical protein